MARETKAQKTTRVALLVAEYDARSRELRKLVKDVESLKAQVKEVEPGTYGEWIVSTGTPRENLDQAQAKIMLTEAGLKIPTKMSEAPVVVTFAPAK